MALLAGARSNFIHQIFKAERFRSLIIGFALSLLGSILLFLGQLGSFAGPFDSFFLKVLLRPPLSKVLYTIGILVSLVGTGFVIGVSCAIPTAMIEINVL